MSGHRSIYPSQILAFIKSPALRVETGKELQEIKGQIHFSAKDADPYSALLMKGSATAMRRIRGNIRRRKNLPAKIEHPPGEQPQSRAEPDNET